jgi:hypothetical protein
MSEKGLEPRAKVVEPRRSVFCHGKAVFGTIALAYRQPTARAALCRELVPFIRAKTTLRLRVHEVAEWRFPDAADQVFRGDKMVT